MNYKITYMDGYNNENSIIIKDVNITDLVYGMITFTREYVCVFMCPKDRIVSIELIEEA